MENAKILLLISCITLVACTDPMDRAFVVDGPKAAQFDVDLAQCKAVVQGVPSTDAREGAMAGAVAGAALGAMDNPDDAAEGALAGAAIGALVGAAEAEDTRKDTQRDAVIRCMQNRGHKVIA